MTRLGLASALVLACSVVPAARAHGPLNVLLVLADDVGARDPGFAGGKRFRTPNLDRLAASGARFDAGYSASPTHHATWNAVFSGLVPARQGFTGLPDPPSLRPTLRLLAPEPRPDWAEEARLVPLLKDAGYSTKDGKPPEPGSENRLEWLMEHAPHPFFAVLRGRPDGTHADRLTALDTAVGRALDRLDSLKIADRTLVIFTSSNGGIATRVGNREPDTSNAPLREGKGFLYEGGVRVPLLVRWPGVTRPGQVVTAPAWTADLFPTVLDAAGVAPPAVALDGVSLRGVLSGQAPERPLHWHFPQHSAEGGRPASAIRRGDWKLVEYLEDGRRELFHLAKDPSESRNRLEEEPALAAKLAAELQAWRASVKAGMPRPNPGYRPPTPGKDGTLTLHARDARVTGLQLRYEPLPHKDTLGFWIDARDSAAWDFELPAAGRYKVVGLIGCGTGSGGSAVEFALGGSVLKLTVPETGGFQAFREMELGTVDLPAGRGALGVRATRKPGVAVMDLREVRLVPQGR